MGVPLMGQRLVPMRVPMMGQPGFPQPLTPMGMSFANHPRIALAPTDDPLAVLPAPEEEEEEPLETECNARYNIEELVADIVVNSEYYKSLFRFTSVDAVIEEFLKHAKNLEPRIPGLSRKASTAFCILYKLLSMKLTKPKAMRIVHHKEPLVRCLGLLILRYTLKPTLLWKYLEEHLDDDSPVTPGSDGSRTTVGEFATKLLSETRYFGTTLPRIPKAVQLIFNREIVRRDILMTRDRRNEVFRDDIEVGDKVEAQYSADWKFYPAIVDKLLDDGSFLVTFDGYDEQEEVTIGMLKVTPKKRKRKRDSSSRDRDRDRDRKRRRSRSRDRGRRRDRDRSRERRSKDRDRRSREQEQLPAQQYPDELTNDVLDKIIKERESRAAHAVGRNYARPPMGLKRGLSIKHEIATARMRSQSPEEGPRNRRRVRRNIPKPAPKPVRQAPSEEYLMRMKKLMEKYGCDNSGSGTAL